MTATVISLESRRPQPEQTCTCVQHRLWDLSDRVREALASTDGELLIAREVHVRVIEDVIATIARTMDTRAEVER